MSLFPLVLWAFVLWAFVLWAFVLWAYVCAPFGLTIMKKPVIRLILSSYTFDMSFSVPSDVALGAMLKEIVDSFSVVVVI